MSIVWVHLVSYGEEITVFMHDDSYRNFDPMTISPAMAKVLCIDCYNRACDGQGHVTPLPLGWVWDHEPYQIEWPTPPKLSEVPHNSLVGSYHHLQGNLERREAIEFLDLSDYLATD